MATKPRIDAVHAAIEQLSRLLDLFRERREQLATAAGLTDAQWQLLEEISSEHFMPSMFAKTKDSSRASVSKILRQLLDRGLVQVAISPTDGRQRDYALTADGKTMMSQLRREREKAISAIWMQLDAGALARFSDFTGDLITRIERYAGKGGAKE